MKNVVFITGGSGAIGCEICREFAKIGYPVAIGYNSNQERAITLANEINSNGGTALAVKCDLSRAESVYDAISLIKENLGSVEILVNNAGVSDIGLFTDINDDRLADILNINLTGAMICSKAVLPDMIAKKQGKIVNITSVWGEFGASCEVVYSASKAGLIGFTKALAKEVAPSGINVNAVSAGYIDTPMNSHLSSDDVAEIINEIPASRLGTPADVAKTVRFLASDDASYINGQVLRVDGGWQG